MKDIHKEFAVDRLFDIINEIDELRSEAMLLVRKHSDPSNLERSRRGWSAQIEKALSLDHFWLSETTMDTLECTAKAIETEFDEGEVAS
jgi:hypothetical protein